MNTFFKKIARLRKGHLADVALLSGTTALLLFIAVFIATGGMGRVSNFLASNKIFPTSQIAGLVAVYINLSVQPTTVQPGAQAIASWTSYQADNCWIYSYNRPSGAIAQQPGYNYSQSSPVSGASGQYGTGAMSQDYSAIDFQYVAECQNFGGSNHGQNVCGANEGQCPPAAPNPGTPITFLPYYPPTFNYFTVTPTVPNGGSATISWSVTPSNRGTTSALYGYGGSLYGSGTPVSGWSGTANTGPLYTNTAYAMVIIDGHFGNVASPTLTVNVASAPPPASPPYSTMSQDQSTTAPGDGWNLYWNTSGTASACTMSITKPDGSYQSFSQTANGSSNNFNTMVGTFTWQFSCSGPGGSGNTATLYHTVSSATPPPSSGPNCNNATPGGAFGTYPSCTCSLSGYTYSSAGNTCTAPTPPPTQTCPSSYSDVTGVGDVNGTVWGSGPFTNDSNVGTIGVFSGLISAGQTATFHRTDAGYITSYAASTHNGVTTNSWGGFCGINVTLASPPAQTCPATYADETVTGNTTATIYGSGPYNANYDPTIQGAQAVHAGLITNGQTATLHITNAGVQSTMPGSTRNGITSFTQSSPACGVNLSLVVTAPPMQACPAHCPGTGAPSCVADTGYAYNATDNTCTATGAGMVTQFIASPSRVQKGHSTTLSWTTTSMASCSLTKNGSQTPLSTLTGSSGLTQTINSKTIFTLSCTDNLGAVIPPVSATVNLVPLTQEL